MKNLILILFLVFQDTTPQANDSSLVVSTPIAINENVNHSTKGYPVGRDSVLFIHYGIGPYTIEERAERIADHIEQVRHTKLSSQDLKIEKNEAVHDLFCGELLIMSINQADADAIGLSKNAAARYYSDLIIKSSETEVSEPLNIQSLLINIAIALLIIGLFFFGLKYFNRLFRLLYMKVHGQKGKFLNGFSVKSYQLLTAEKQVLFAIYIVKGVRIAVLILIIYLLLPVLFSLFPWTQDIANTLFGYILDPLKEMGYKFVDFIPNLLTITVIILVVKYILKALRFFKEEVARGKLELPGFYPEWAKPTFNIVKILIIALSFIAIWPMLPMSDSDIFKGVSTFIGLLVALGGAGAISNVIAGLVITYMRSFKIGDRVKIGEVMGDVKEKSLLNTRIKTIKNEIITIPNSQMLNSHTINYTTANDEDGLILHTTITLGYDVPWRKAHEVLIQAALDTEFVKKLPKPYVLQTSLDDFYVSYQLNARTREIHKMAVIYSEMHKNIQDLCNKEGIEILSPHYGAQRDGNHSTIPQEHLPEDYQAPWFRIKKE